MTLLQKLEKRLGWIVLPNITLTLMLGQILVFGLTAFGSFNVSRILLVPELVLRGEVWRVVSFIFVPPMAHPIFMAFAWYLFYLMGTALEEYWGAFRYNLFLWVGFLATVAAAFAVPGSVASNAFILGSVFLAFAFLHPNFELMLFFIVPVKIKWLAAVAWLMYGLQFVGGSASDRMMVLATVANFLLFFGADILRLMKARRRRAEFDKRVDEEADEPFHRCHVCGITDKTDPDMEFRYCSKCAGHHAYCEKHLSDHEHVREES